MLYSVARLDMPLLLFRVSIYICIWMSMRTCICMRMDDCICAMFKYIDVYGCITVLVRIELVYKLSC